MIPDALVEIGTALAPLAVRATVVLGAAALIYHVGLRRSSGAVRHLVLTATALRSCSFRR